MRFLVAVLFVTPVIWLMPAVAMQGPTNENPHCRTIAQKDWLWTRVYPTELGGWNVDHGTALVTFKKKKFTAELISSASLAFTDYSFKGTINGTHIVATEVQNGTDANPMTYSGTIIKERTPLTAPSNGWGSDRISLHNRFWFVGLYRQIRTSCAAN